MCEHQGCTNSQLSGAAADVSPGMQLGKGKWKKILDEAGDVFKSRSQVDLKDKWRNLERQGIVQAPVKAGPASGVDTSGFCILGICTWCLLRVLRCPYASPTGSTVQRLTSADPGR